MNLYFLSVFTQEQSNLPEFGNIINDKLSIILGATSEVEKYLKTHWMLTSPHRARSDPTSHLERMCTWIVNSFECIFKQFIYHWVVVANRLEDSQHYTNSQKGTQAQKRELPSNLFNLCCLQSGGVFYSTIQSYSFLDLVRSPRLKSKSVWLLKREIFACRTAKLFSITTGA